MKLTEPLLMRRLDRLLGAAGGITLILLILRTNIVRARKTGNISLKFLNDNPLHVSMYVDVRQVY